MKRRRKDFREKIKKIICERSLTKYFVIIGIIIGIFVSYILLNTPSFPSEEDQKKYYSIAECIFNNDLDEAKVKIENIEKNTDVKITSKSLIFKEKWSTKCEAIVTYDGENLNLELRQRSDMYLPVLVLAVLAGVFVGWFLSMLIELILAIVLVIDYLCELIANLIKKSVMKVKK